MRMTPTRILALVAACLFGVGADARVPLRYTYPYPAASEGVEEEGPWSVVYDAMAQTLTVSYAPSFDITPDEDPGRQDLVYVLPIRFSATVAATADFEGTWRYTYAVSSAPSGTDPIREYLVEVGATATALERPASFSAALSYLIPRGPDGPDSTWAFALGTAFAWRTPMATPTGLPPGSTGTFRLESPGIPGVVLVYARGPRPDSLLAPPDPVVDRVGENPPFVRRYRKGHSLGPIAPSRYPSAASVVDALDRFLAASVEEEWLGEPVRAEVAARLAGLRAAVSAGDRTAAEAASAAINAALASEGVEPEPRIAFREHLLLLLGMIP